MEEIYEKAKEGSSLVIIEEMDLILFSMYKLGSKEDNDIKEVLEKVTKLVKEFKFESFNSKDEDHVYFIKEFVYRKL